jgi:hypothetical protein
MILKLMCTWLVLFNFIIGDARIHEREVLILFVLFYDYYILHMLTCMDASLKTVYTVSLTTQLYHFRSEKQTISLR